MGNMNIYAFADEASANIDEQIIALNRNGLHGLEIRNVDGINVSDISVAKAMEVKEKLDANGLISWSIGSPIGKIHITDPFAEHLEKFKHTLEIADVLNCKNIRLFSFYIPKDRKAEEYKNQVLDRLGQFVSLAAGTGVTLCHENEKGIYGDIPQRAFEIHESFPEIMEIFDPANYVQSGVDTRNAWEILKKFICYMHIKDAKSDGFVVPAGYGDGNLKEIVADYVKRGGQHFTIEPHLAVFNGLNALEREGEETKIEFRYSDNNEAFDAACAAFRRLL